MNGAKPTELGLTIPLQRHLGIKAPSYSGEPDRRFCRDLHVILLRGRSSLLAVHCHSMEDDRFFAGVQVEPSVKSVLKYLGGPTACRAQGEGPRAIKRLGPF